MYKNNFKVALQCKMIEVSFDGYVPMNDGVEIRKTTAIVEAIGENEDGDVLEVTAWGEKADYLYAVQDGEEMEVKANIRTRFVERRDGDGFFSSTEVTAYHVKRVEYREDGTKRKRENEARNQQPRGGSENGRRGASDGAQRTRGENGGNTRRESESTRARSGGSENRSGKPRR